MFFDPLYLVLALPGFLLAMWAQMQVKRTFNHYRQVGTRRGYSGEQIARAILRSKGISGVDVVPSQGFLSDHYDPTRKVLALSPDVFSGRSVAAAGVAAHEVGHAIQHAEGYRPLQLRSKLVPAVQITSTVAMPMFFGGMILSAFSAQLGIVLLQLGALAFGGMVLFQLVTLPVEFDASRRAMVAMEQGQLLGRDELPGARKVLRAAALTYVAAAIQSLMTFVYFLIRSGLLGGRSND